MTWDRDWQTCRMALTFWQTTLANELRRLRELTSLRQAEVCRQLGWGQTKLSTIENANVTVSDEDLARLLDTYGVFGPQRDALMGMNQPQKGGWFDFHRDNLPSDYMQYIRLEDQASEIWTWDVSAMLNGLLQTEAYARETIAVTTMGRISQADVDRRVYVRMQRQEILSRENPTKLHAIVAEHVVLWRVGGLELMQEQCEHLAALCRLPNVTIQVVRLIDGAHPAMQESFSLLQFGGSATPPAAYSDGVDQNRYYVTDSTVDAYKVSFGQLRAKALGVEESAAHFDYLADCYAEGRTPLTLS